MQSIWKDARYGVRTLARSPGFTLVALLTLALGIGANTAIFSAVYRVLLHPLPYPHSDRLVAISRTGDFIPRGRTNGPGPAPRILRGQPGQGSGTPSARQAGAPEMRIVQPGQTPAPQAQFPAAASGKRLRRVVPGPGHEKNRSGRVPEMRVVQPGKAPARGANAPNPSSAQAAAGAGAPNRVFGTGAGPQGQGPERRQTISMGGAPGGGRPGAGGGRPTMTVFSFPDFQYLRAQTHAFEEVAGYHETQVTLTHRGEPESLRAAVTSASLFPLLDAKPLLGRLFSTDDDREGAPPVALIGQGLWRDRYGSDPGVIGQTIDLNDQAYTVIGVLPASLQFPPFSAPAEVWIPLVSDPVAQIQQMRQQRLVNYLTVLGRLNDGVSLERANAQLKTLADRLGASYPEEAGLGIGATPLSKQLVQSYQLALLVLLAAVGLVLLIACANVANLLLARATVRERELALRLALGAGTAGIVRQMLVEGLELALAGGAAGAFVAYLAVGAFVQNLPPMLQEFQGVTVNAAVLVFAAIVSMGAGIVMGLLPAWRLSDLRVHETLKGAGSGVAAGAAKGRLRAALVVLEVALAVVLLAGAGLLLRSFGKLVSVPLGFQPHGVLMASTNLSSAGFKDPGQWKSFTQDALRRLRAQPGVLAAAAAVSPPMSGMRMIMSFSIPGQPLAPDEMPIADLHMVSPGYIELMRIPLLHGRTFTDTDTDSSAKVCLVNQELVARYFPNVDPLTKQLSAGMQQAPCQIVGVVGNVVTGSLAAAPDPAIYLPFQQSPFFAPSFLLRSAGNPAGLSSVLSEQLHAQSANLPVQPVTLASLLSRSLEQDRLRATLVGLFALLAIVLAAVGISGVLGYSVSRRTQEIGVRMALGATPREVLGLVVGEGLRLVGIGAAVGIVAALGLTRFLRTLLYGVGPGDVWTYVAVIALLLLVALGACALPALRASRVDPTVALRYE